MRIPEFLKEGGTIGFVAPSFGCNIEPYKSGFENALKRFHELGYKTDIGPNCMEGKGVGISNTPEKCGAELSEYMGEKRADAIISCGGGELMCETLDFVDFEKIALAKPTWYMGFSDNTNMTFLLPTLCDTAAFYAPCAPAFGMRTWHQSVQDAYHLLTGKTDTIHGYDKWEKESLKNEENPLEPYNVTEPRKTKVFVKDSNGCGVLKDASEANADIEMDGRLIGGCLDCLDILVGTKYDKVKEFNERYKEDGIIWFMEACELNTMSIRRALWQLKHAGWFEHLKGFMIGRPLCFGQEDYGLNQYEAVTAALAEYHVPIIMDLDIGHLPPMMPMISGAYAKVSLKGNDITVKYDFRKS